MMERNNMVPSGAGNGLVSMAAGVHKAWIGETGEQTATAATISTTMLSITDKDAITISDARQIWESVVKRFDSDMKCFNYKT